MILALLGWLSQELVWSSEPLAGPVYQLAMSPDGTKLAVQGEGRRYLLLDVSTASELHSFEPVEDDDVDPPDVIFSPDGEWLVFWWPPSWMNAGSPYAHRLDDVSTKKPLKVRTCADETVALGELGDLRIVEHTPTYQPSEHVVRTVFTGSRGIATSSPQNWWFEDGRLEHYAVEEIQDAEGAHYKVVHSVLEPSAAESVRMHEWSVVQLGQTWSLFPSTNGREVAHIRDGVVHLTTSSGEPITRFGQNVTAVLWDGERWVTGHTGSAVMAWTGTEAVELLPPEGFEWKAVVGLVDTGPDVVAMCGAGTVDTLRARGWSTTVRDSVVSVEAWGTGVLVRTSTGLEIHGPSGVEMRKGLGAASSHEAGRLALFDGVTTYVCTADAGEVVQRLRPFSAPVVSATFFGDYILCGGESCGKALLDRASGTVIRSWPDDAVVAVRDGSFAYAENGIVSLEGKNRQLQTFQISGEVVALALAPDCSKVAAQTCDPVSGYGNLHLLDVGGGEAREWPSGGRPEGLEFSADGESLVVSVVSGWQEIALGSSVTEREGDFESQEFSQRFELGDGFIVFGGSYRDGEVLEAVARYGLSASSPAWSKSLEGIGSFEGLDRAGKNALVRVSKVVNGEMTCGYRLLDLATGDWGGSWIELLDCNQRGGILADGRFLLPASGGIALWEPGAERATTLLTGLEADRVFANPDATEFAIARASRLTLHRMPAR